MKHLPIALCLAFSLFTCGKQLPKETLVEVGSVYLSIAPPSAPFVARISTEQDNTLSTPNDVKVFIPANAFADVQGNLITGEVDVSLTEVFTTAETVLRPISTVTVEGELLASKGMIKIEASQEGKVLELAGGGPIELTMPGEEEAYEGYDLFYGSDTDDGTIKWRLANAISREDLVDTVAEPELPITVIIIQMKHGKRYFANPQPGAEYEKAINNFTQFSEEELIKYSGKSVTVFFRLFEDGEIGPHTVIGEISNREKKDILQRFEKLPRLELPNQEEDFQGTFYFSYDSPAVEDIRKKDREFTMAVTKLGWTNCDVFLRLELPVANMTVPRPTDSTLVKLVFTNFKTTVGSSDIEIDEQTFNGMPTGAAVHVVAVTPYGDKVQLSVTTTKVNSRLAELNTPEIMTRQEMVRRLNALN